MKKIASILTLLLCAALSNAQLPEEGHYQVMNLTMSLTLSQDGGDSRPRGFNNTGLYVVVTGRRVRMVGAWRGHPIRRDAVIERTIRDTLVLRDAENSSNTFKLHISNNIVTGRRQITGEDGTQQVITVRAALRKLRREEVDRLRAIFKF